MELLAFAVNRLTQFEADRMSRVPRAARSPVRALKSPTSSFTSARVEAGHWTRWSRLAACRTAAMNGAASLVACLFVVEPVQAFALVSKVARASFAGCTMAR